MEKYKCRDCGNTFISNHELEDEVQLCKICYPKYCEREARKRDKKEKEPLTITRIEACRFKREEGSNWEKGILINEGELGILDKYGKIPKTVWNWERRYHFAMNLDWYFEGILKQKKGLPAKKKKKDKKRKNKEDQDD